MREEIEEREKKKERERERKGKESARSYYVTSFIEKLPYEVCLLQFGVFTFHAILCMYLRGLWHVHILYFTVW